MVRVSGGQAVVEALKAQGVRHLFFLPGSCNVEILDALYDAKEIRGVAVRHEQTAAHMADAYARITGSHGVCLVHNGPGLTNAVTGVAEAYLAHSPVVLMAGAPMTSQLFKDSIQEIDQISLLRPIVKWSAQVNRAERIPELLRHAFRVAMTGRKGPVHVDLPRDILLDVVDVDIWPRERYEVEAEAAPGRALIEKAANLLLKAQKPIVIAGGGVVWSDATPEVIRLAQLLTIPVATSYGHGDAMPSDHPLWVGQLGRDGSPVAKKLTSQADVILALGTRLAHFTSFYSSEFVSPHAKIIQVDVDARELGRNFPVEVGIVGDAREAAKELASTIENLAWGAVPINANRLTEIRFMMDAWKRERNVVSESSSIPIKPQRVYAELRKVLPRDGIVCLDDGSCCGFAYHQLDFFEPRTFVSPLDLACIGFGYPAALGAKVARPEKPVVAVCGDGGFIMSIQEIATAIQHGINVVAVVMNNNSWGSEKAYQKYYYGGRYIGVDLVNPDFAKVAEAFGAFGVRAERPSEIGPALKSALSSGKPAVVEIPVDPNELTAPVRSDVMRLKRA